MSTSLFPNSEGTTSATYDGGCHCGRIKFTVKASPPLEENSTIVDCNCSICSIKGLLLVHVPNDYVDWMDSIDNMTSYTFGPKRASHLFCPVCGTSVGARSNDPSFFPDTTAINVRTIKDVDLDALKIRKVDGKKY